MRPGLRWNHVVRAVVDSLPGTGEEPSCPVYIDGEKTITLHGNYDELSAAFRKLVDDYIQTRYSPRVTASSAQR